MTNQTPKSQLNFKNLFSRLRNVYHANNITQLTKPTLQTKNRPQSMYACRLKIIDQNKIGMRHTSYHKKWNHNTIKSQANCNTYANTKIRFFTQQNHLPYTPTNTNNISNKSQSKTSLRYLPIGNNCLKKIQFPKNQNKQCEQHLKKITIKDISMNISNQNPEIVYKTKLLKGLKKNRNKKIQNNINVNYIMNRVRERDRDRNFSIKSCEFGGVQGYRIF